MRTGSLSAKAMLGLALVAGMGAAAVGAAGMEAAPDGAPARSPDAAYSFLALADLHYDRATFHAPGAEDANGYVAMWDERSPRFLDRMARQAKTDGSAFALVLGDFVNAPFSDFDIQCRAVAEAWDRIRSAFAGITVYPVMGNHESYLGHGYPSYRHVMLPRIAELLGKPAQDVHYAFMHGEDLFVVIDTNRGDMLAFVRDVFARHPDARHTFVAGHAPILPSSSGSVGYLKPSGLDSSGRLLALLQARNAIYMCGDLHRLNFCEYVSGAGRVVQISAASVCVDPLSTFHEGSDYPATPEEKAGAPRAVPGDQAPEWRQFRDGMVRHWLGDGTMYYVVHVSNDRIVAALHLSDRDEPVKEIVLHDAATNVQPLGMTLPPYFPPEGGAVELRKPPALAASPAYAALDLPEGWTVAGGNPAAMPGPEATLRIVPAGSSLQRRPERIRARLLDGDGRLRANAFQTFLYQDVLEAPRHDPSAPPPLLPPMGPAGASERRMAFAWDERGLHVFARIRDDAFKPLPPEQVKSWWTGASLELFLDPFDAKPVKLDGGMWQVVLIPSDGESVAALALTIGPDGRQVLDASGRGIEGRHAFDKAKGVLDIEATIPWSAVQPASGSFTPRAGAVLGVDAAYRDAPLLGAATKVHANPSAWGRIRLVEATR